jgi:excisionase family DNA binding protein
MNHPHRVEPSASAANQVNRNPSRSSRPMNPKEAAEDLRLDEKTITRWARKGYIPAHPLGEGKRKFWRFLEHELVDWLNSQTNSDADRE